jgi:hypothetical protein
MPVVTPTLRPGLRAAAERRLAAVGEALSRRPAWPTLLALVIAVVGAGFSLASHATMA